MFNIFNQLKDSTIIYIFRTSHCFHEIMVSVVDIVPYSAVNCKKDKSFHVEKKLFPNSAVVGTPS